MIPLRVRLLRTSTPVATLLLIFVNTFIFLYEEALPVYARDRLFEIYGLVPDHFHPTMLLTSMFLHGSWLHIIGNMWFLWVFGSHLENAMGTGKYLIFYIISGLASAFVQLVTSFGSPVPTIGASGAIAGVMGGFLVLYPRVRVVTLIFIVIFITTIDIPAAIMLLYWFALQLFSGLGSIATATQAQGIAWFAHVGGFIAGIVLVRVFAGNRSRFIPSSF
ncbi:MAG: rhomboid family intramembrane serine protease [Acidobacteriaceae bacterium]|nr:rhomboid family intramembrane serine protease [Acidobacteriaceae bacterium]MBV8572555.1 rhomboid family intramembrane serine protease [Acidobacteriaceae bacterium]